MPRGLQVASTFGKKSSGGSGPLRLRLKEGESATVRFLEQGDDIFYYYYHDFSHLDPNNGFKTAFPCLDQDDEGKDSPGTEQGFPRKFRTSINVIWRDAPKYERDKEGKIVTGSDGKWKQIGTEDQVAVWEGGQTVFKSLAEKDRKYGGLGSLELEIERSGTGFDTKYSIEPADFDKGKTPLTEEDEKLAEKKYDLEKVARLDMTYDEVTALINKQLGATETSDDTADDVAGFLDGNDPFADEE